MAPHTTLHVVPANDLIGHDVTVASGESCVCGPRAGLAEAGDGTVGWMVVHYSLDGRELGRNLRVDPGE